jgi:ATP-dependent DNA ligase
LIASLPDTIRFSETFEASAAELMAAVRSNGLEGIVAKWSDSLYKPGDRSGAWIKVRANRAQEFVLRGYLPGSTTFDSLLVGYYEGRELMYAPRIRNGFTPASRRVVFDSFDAPNDVEMPVQECPRVEQRQVGRRSNGRGDGAVPLAQARAGGDDRVP